MKKLDEYRQGDILLRKIKEVSGKLVGESSFVLAEGETTGHKHVLRGDGIRFFDAGNGQIVVQVEEVAELIHEEHSRIEVPAGVYEVIRQRELTAQQAVKQVAD